MRSTAEENQNTATVTLTTEITNGRTFSTWKELVKVTIPEQDGAAKLNPSASDYMDAEIVLLRKIQQESFGEDIATEEGERCDWFISFDHAHIIM